LNCPRERNDQGGADRWSGIEREAGGSRGLLGSVGGVLGVRRFVGGDARFRREAVCLTPLLVRDHSRTRRNTIQVGHIAFSVATRNDYEAGRWAVLPWSTSVRSGPPAHRREDCRKPGVVVVGVVDGSKAGRVEVAIERSGPQLAAFGRPARGRRLERGSDPSARLVARRVTGALEHIPGGTGRSLDAIAKPARRSHEILSALCPGRRVLVCVPRIGSGGQELGDQRGIFDCELIDSPHSNGRLADLAGGESRIRIGASEFAHQGGSPCDEVLERAVIQVSGIH
jgi:hypothetical protein